MSRTNILRLVLSGGLGMAAWLLVPGAASGDIQGGPQGCSAPLQGNPCSFVAFGTSGGYLAASTHWLIYAGATRQDPTSVCAPGATVSGLVASGNGPGAGPLTLSADTYWVQVCDPGSVSAGSSGAP